MTPEANKAIVRHWIVDVMGGDLRLIDQLVTPDYVYSSPQDKTVGVDGARALFTQIRSAFPDLENKIEEQIAEGNKVVSRGITSATHRGAWAGIPATGKQVTVAFTCITELRDGRIARDVEVYDALGLLQQLGAVPAMA